MIIVMLQMPLFHHLYGRLPIQRPVSLHADGLQGLYSAQTELLVIIYYKHPPRRQDHILFLYYRLLQIQGHTEHCSFALFALYFDSSAHGIHNVFRYRHTKPGSLYLLDTVIVFPCKGLKYLVPKLLRHTNPAVFHRNADTAPVLSLRRFFFKHGHPDTAALRSKLDGIGQEVEKYLIQPHTVAAYVLCADVMYKHVKILVFLFYLRLYDAHNTLDHFSEGNLIHIQVHFTALYLRHIQYIIDKPQKMLAGQSDFSQAILHLLHIADISGCNSRHAHDRIHRSTDIMAHIR